MSTLELNGKDFATQTSSAEPVLASTVTGSPALTLTNATFPAGHIVQVLSANKNTVVSRTSSEATSGTWQDITGITVTITPTTGNKVLVNVSLSLSTANPTYVMLVRLYRTNSGGSGVINGGVEVGDREASFGKVYIQNISEIMSINMTYLDTPPAGASIYKAQWQGETGTTFYLNQGGTDTDTANFGRYASNITVMEVQV